MRLVCLVVVEFLKIISIWSITAVWWDFEYLHCLKSLFVILCHLVFANDWSFWSFVLLVYSSDCMEGRCGALYICLNWTRCSVLFILTVVFGPYGREWLVATTNTYQMSKPNHQTGNILIYHITNLVNHQTGNILIYHTANLVYNAI